jgi:tetratricopeptide (TPR) repeat protein
MNEYGCGLTDREEMAARYVAGQLDAHEVAAYELHFLSCAECHKRIGEATALRSGLRRRRRRRTAFAILPVPLAAAALMALLLTRPNSIRELGKVAAPTIRALEVRASMDSAAAHAAHGIAAYRAGDYATASRWLADAYTIQPQPGTAFYLASSLLMSGQADSAATVYRAVIASGNMAYQAEAHFYAAKAWLQTGRPDSARSHLQAAAQFAGPFSVHARALLDSLRRIE